MVSGKQPCEVSWELFTPIAGEVERGDYLELGYFEQEVEGGNRQTPLSFWNAFPA